MIQRVVAQARQASLARVVVATDDERILRHVQDFGGEAVLTRPDHPSGTDRLWEAFQQLGSPAEVHCIVNIQGDEPFIQPAQINALVDLFADAATAPDIATLVKPVLTEEELFSPHLPKVVLNQQGHALYFSRHPLPYQREPRARPVAGPPPLPAPPGPLRLQARRAGAAHPAPRFAPRSRRKPGAAALARSRLPDSMRRNRAGSLWHRYARKTWRSPGARLA